MANDKIIAALDKYWIPFSKPVLIEMIKMTVATAMTISWTNNVLGTPNMSCIPAVTCMAPRPRDVAIPKTVAKTERISIVLPIGP